jgi:GT2 family glycosyltransferase
VKLAVVMVHYRTPALAIESLRSLAPEAASIPGTRVRLVENSSDDGSEEKLAAAIEREGWSGWVDLIPAGRNGGFAVGNNLAFRRIFAETEQPEYVLLLNPDTIVHAGALRPLLEFLDAHPGVGTAGSRLEDPDASAQRSAFRFPNLAAEFDAGLRLGIVSRLLARKLVAPPVRDDRHATDWVCGASMMIRRRVFDDIGLFDEAYFLYSEETDFCLRARRKGWDCWYVPESRVVHLGGQSTGVNDMSQRMPSYWFESRRHYFEKNYGRAYLLLANLLWITGYSLWTVRRTLQNRPDDDKPRMFSDFIRLSFASGREAR